MHHAAKRKTQFTASLAAVRLLLLLVVACGGLETRVWSFAATPQPASDEITFATPSFIGENYDGFAYDASDSLVAAEATALRNPNVYEALFESPISGTSRAAHRASANEFFANQLRNDAQLNGMFNQELGGNVLQQMESGSSGLRNPPGTVWHHPFDSPNVMQLLRTSEHTAPSLQPVLHPSGVGGFGNFYGP